MKIQDYGKWTLVFRNFYLAPHLNREYVPGWSFTHGKRSLVYWYLHSKVMTKEEVKEHLEKEKDNA